MKLLLLTISFSLLTSCQKEYDSGNSLAPQPLATFSLLNASGNCTNAVVNGTYTAGISLTAANTISIKVFVSSIGTYSISSNNVNGISFSATGTFTSTGEQTIHLLGTGTPAAEGNFNFTAGASGCSFSVTTAASGKATAVFTYHGAPSSCTNVSRAGTYRAGIAVTSSNKVKMDVNVIVPGTYIITTDVINGFSFTGTGKFETMGFGTVLLQATGIPLTAGTFIFTPGNNGCRFPITVDP